MTLIPFDFAMPLKRDGVFGIYVAALMHRIRRGRGAMRVAALLLSAACADYDE